MKRPDTRPLVFALLAALTVTGHVAASEVNGGSDCDAAGGVASVPVTFVNDSRIAGLQFDLTYDPAEVASGTPVPGGALADHVIDWSEATPGILRIVIHSPTSAELGSGELVAVPFTIDADATTSPIPLSIPLNDPGVYDGPGAILANIGAVEYLPSPDPGPGEIDLIEITGPDPVSTCIGGEAPFACSANGPGPTSYQWNKDGVPIPGATAADYVIPVAEQTDIGDYHCDINDAVCGDFSSDPAWLSVAYYPCAPENLRVYDPGVTGEMLQAEWVPNPSPSVDSYTLLWGESAHGSYEWSMPLPVSDGANVSGLTDGTRYYFRVSAAVGPIEGQYSNVSHAVPTAGGLDLPQAPDYGYQAPVSADTAHPDVVTYRFPPRAGDVSVWYDVYDVDHADEVAIRINGQEVARPASVPGNWAGGVTLALPDALVKDAEPNVLTFDNLDFDDDPPDTEETWAVRMVSLELPAPGVTAQAWNLTVDLAIQQSPVEPTLGFYDVHRSTTPGFNPSPSNRIATGFVGSPYRDDDGLVNDTTYHYLLRPVDTIGNPGVPSDEDSATPNDFDVTPVVDLMVSRSGVNDLDLDWSAVTTAGGVKHYKIYEGMAPGVLVFTGGTTTSTTSVRSGEQSDGFDHYYMVGVVDNADRESSQ